jgi:hypothetical protein
MSDVEELGPESCAQVAKRDLERALQCLEQDDWDHARMYVGSATIWLRGAVKA